MVEDVQQHVDTSRVLEPRLHLVVLHREMRVRRSALHFVQQTSQRQRRVPCEGSFHGRVVVKGQATPRRLARFGGSARRAT